jgi:type I restriction enzyme S subunit
MDSTILQPPGNYPDDWVRTDFDHFATLQRGKDLTRDHFRTGSVPVAGSNGVIGHHDTANVRAPGITVGRSGSVGKVTFYQQDFWAHNTALFVKDFHGNVPAFIAFFLDFLRLGRFGSGASVPTLDRNVFRTLPIVIPPPCEQRKIAAVLRLVQRAIEQQERLIALTTELKKALLHKLFTEGLRGEPQKQTEIGPVPESWEIVRLGEICTLGTGTTPSTARPEYYNGDVPFVKTADIANNRINISQTNVSNEAVKDCGLKLYPPGTVLMAMYGQGKTRGQVSLLEISAATSQNAAAIQPSTEINSEFLWQYLTSRYQVLRGSGALGHISHLNLGYVRDFQIPKPSIVIQREIAEILRTIDSRLTLIESRKRLLDDLFRTLLHQLMTAQIRVHDLDPSALPVYPRNLPHE